jgi:hypothetical protein
MNGAWIQVASGFDSLTQPPAASRWERGRLARRLAAVAAVEGDAGPAAGGMSAVRFFSRAPIVSEAGDPPGLCWAADRPPRTYLDAETGCRPLQVRRPFWNR